jgi:site-specific DNA-methyltransferase (adenine-specific)
MTGAPQYPDIRGGDVANLNWIEPHSVDCIITDPPYLVEYLPVYSALAASAARVLKSGGSCFVLAGHYHLPEVLHRLGEHLRYDWIHAYVMPGGGVPIWSRQMRVFWKPLVQFTNGPPPPDRPWLPDIWKSRSPDKEHHSWGQSESGIGSIVRAATEPGDVICDPFLGGGTTAFCALALGRRFVGCDIDPAAVATTLARLDADLFLRRAG